MTITTLTQISTTNRIGEVSNVPAEAGELLVGMTVDISVSLPRRTKGGIKPPAAE